MIRDPRGVMLSQKRKWKRRKLGADFITKKEVLRLRINYHPITIAKLWNSAVGAVKNFETRDGFINVRFEDLLENPEATVQGICEFADLNYEPSMLEVPHAGSSSEADKKEVKGIKKGRAKGWEEKGLTPAEIRICQETCEELMDKYSYNPIEVKPAFGTITWQYISFPFKLVLALFWNLNRMRSIGDALKRRLAKKLMDRRVELFGLEFQPFASTSEVAQDVLKKDIPDDGRIPLMITPNVDQIVKLERPENETLKRSLAHTQWILADGQPIVALSKIKYKENGLPARITGSDFFPVIWQELKEIKSKGVYFVLPKPEMGEALKAEKENCQFYAPPFFDLTNKDEFDSVMNRIFDDIEAYNPDYIFLGLGFPKQENIALRIFSHLKNEGKTLPKIFLLGASFEFYLGVKKRAPMIWQKLGLEFLHRLLSEPKRMFKRYLVDDLAFLGIGIRELRAKKP